MVPLSSLLIISLPFKHDFKEFAYSKHWIVSIDNTLYKKKQKKFIPKKKPKQTYNIDDHDQMSLHDNHVHNYCIADEFSIDIDRVLDYLYKYDLKDIDKDSNQLNLNPINVKDTNNHPLLKKKKKRIKYFSFN